MVIMRVDDDHEDGSVGNSLGVILFFCSAPDNWTFVVQSSVTLFKVKFLNCPHA